MKTGVRFCGMEIEVFISHVKYEDKLIRGGGTWNNAIYEKANPKVNTLATVKIGSEEFRSAASCAASDTFSRRKGVSIALSRALKLAGLDKQTRAAIWSRVWNNKYDKVLTTTMA